MKDLRCLLGIHKWIRGHDADRAVVAECARCRKQDHDPGGRAVPLG